MNGVNGNVGQRDLPFGIRTADIRANPRIDGGEILL
jgi:hypothetical protein